MTDQPEIAPCPRCGSRCDVRWFARPFVACVRFKLCGYRSGQTADGDAAIAAHNRIATAVPLEVLRDVFGQCIIASEQEFVMAFAANNKELELRHKGGTAALERAAAALGIKLEQSDDR